MTIDLQSIRRKRFKELLEKIFDTTQKDMALAIGIPPTLISRYSRGLKPIGEGMRERIEQRLNLSRGWLDERYNQNSELLDIFGLSASQIDLATVEIVRLVAKLGPDQKEKIRDAAAKLAMLEIEDRRSGVDRRKKQIEFEGPDRRRGPRR